MGAQGRENRAGVSAQEYPQRERNLAAEVEDTAPQSEHPEEEVEEGIEAPFFKERAQPPQARAEKRQSAELCLFQAEPEEEEPHTSEPGDAALH